MSTRRGLGPVVTAADYVNWSIVAARSRRDSEMLMLSMLATSWQTLYSRFTFEFIQIVSNVFFCINTCDNLGF